MSKVLLVGNPNCGKTTVFNALTGRAEKVGNLHGVTVGEAEGRIRGTDVTVVDLPGTYDLMPKSEEERVTLSSVKGEYDLIVNIIEAKSLPRALELTGRLKKLGRPMVVVVNMYGELLRLGGAIDIKKMESAVGCPCVLMKTASRREMKIIRELIVNCPSISPPRASDISPVGDFFSPPNYRESRADRVLLSPFFSPVIFAALMGCVFYSAFGKYGLACVLGHFLQKAVGSVNALVFERLSAAGAPSVIVRLLTEGVIGGTSGLVAFIPQLVCLYASLIALEESGYLPRVAYVMDGALKRVGLSGRSVFPLLVGFGCTATAVLCSRGSERPELQRRTILSLNFIPCLARAPVMLFIAAAFFPERQFVAVVTVYLLGIALALLSSGISFKLEGGKVEPFITELPPLRVPKLKWALKQLNYYVKTFIIKIGTVLVAVSVVVWLLRSFSPSLELLGEGEIEGSLLARMGGWISFLFAPMGLGTWQFAVAVLCGLVAKEGMVTALTLAYPLGASGYISPPSAVAMMVFCATYTPCVMTLASQRRETNGRLTAFYVVFTFLSALLMGYTAYFLCRLIELVGFGNLLWIAFSSALIIASVIIIIKRMVNKKVFCAKDCSLCKRKNCKNN